MFGLQGWSATSHLKGGMPMAIQDALSLMISFGKFIIALLTLIVTIIVMFNHKK